MSIQRTFAQRNNNVQTLIPTGVNANINDFIDINVNPLYTSVINVDVRNVTPFNRGPDNIQLFNIVYDETIAQRYPGLEFTVFFDSYESNSIPVSTTVGIVTSDQHDPMESHYPFSAVSGSLVQVLSVTLKSNGRVFNVVSGGPSYWY